MCLLKSYECMPQTLFHMTSDMTCLLTFWDLNADKMAWVDRISYNQLHSTQRHQPETPFFNTLSYPDPSSSAFGKPLPSFVSNCWYLASPHTPPPPPPPPPPPLPPTVSNCQHLLWMKLCVNSANSLKAWRWNHDWKCVRSSGWLWMTKMTTFLPLTSPANCPSWTAFDNKYFCTLFSID